MIEISGLVKDFGKLRALDGLEFTCAPGEMTALVGPNGGGKSTALKIIAGTMRQDRGEVRIAGELMTMNAARLRDRISYLPQRVAFPDQATAKEIIRFFGALRRIGSWRVSQLMSAFGFQGFEKKRVAELSGGMLQRLALAVVFLPMADLYLLDEATNNLDSEGHTRFREQVGVVLERGASVILSTHVLGEAENLAHRIAIVSGGRIILERRIEDFVAELTRSRKMWITMENLSKPFLEIALQVGAEKAVLNCDTMIVECGEQHRIPILNALAQHGAVIKEFGLHEPSLEDMYKQVLGNQRTDLMKP